MPQALTQALGVHPIQPHALLRGLVRTCSRPWEHHCEQEGACQKKGGKLCSEPPGPVPMPLRGASPPLPAGSPFLCPLPVFLQSPSPLPARTLRRHAGLKGGGISVAEEQHQRTQDGRQDRDCHSVRHHPKKVSGRPRSSSGSGPGSTPPTTTRVWCYSRTVPTAGTCLQHGRWGAEVRAHPVTSSSFLEWTQQAGGWAEGSTWGGQAQRFSPSSSLGNQSWVTCSPAILHLLNEGSLFLCRHSRVGTLLSFLHREFCKVLPAWGSGKIQLKEKKRSICGTDVLCGVVTYKAVQLSLRTEEGRFQEPPYCNSRMPIPSC